MSRRIFLDIGSNVGQTLEETVKTEYGFDLIFGFEPIKDCCDEISWTIIDKRLTVNNFGLYSEDCEKTIYYNGKGDVGGSIYEDKVDRNPNSNNREDMVCEFRDVSKWFKDNILETDFDCVKIPSQKHRKVEVENLLTSLGKQNYITYFPAGNTHGDRIGNSIKGIGTPQIR
tara:strand:+ start:114 stop:629 length:516 start_codon:yes stop_codon:yes gene_type:complete